MNELKCEQDELNFFTLHGSSVRLGSYRGVQESEGCLHFSFYHTFSLEKTAPLFAYLRKDNMSLLKSPLVWTIFTVGGMLFTGTINTVVKKLQNNWVAPGLYERPHKVCS